MREKNQDVQDGLVEEQAEVWRPQRHSWSNPTFESTNESPENPSAQPSVFGRTITICVTKGRSVSTTHRLAKSRISIGNMGGGADMRIDDPEVCRLHCAVAITGNGIRLYDLDSVNGTYIDDERIQVADLQDFSAFRIGSTEFVVSIVPKD